MKGIKFILLFVLAVFFSQKNYGQYITTNENYTAQQLVEDVLINSPCATVSNFSVSGGNFTSGEKSYAYFDGTGSTFPFQNGIVLSTGKASNTQGPNNSLSDDGANMGWNGDQDLEQALGISNTLNATILEFDFISVGNKFSFDYIFSSEEYQGSAPCKYSDGFAFLLKEAGSTNQYQNLALVPNTNTPVLVTTVHPLISGGNGCPAINEQYFDAFNGTNHPTNFNGQTVVLTAQADILPNVLYHIKLVIADEENYRYDSAIFIGGGSFNFGIDLGDDRLIANGNPLCQNDSLLLDATQAGTNTYQWFQNGNLLIGETNPTYNITSAGSYAVEVNINGSCISEGEIEIEYAPVLNVIQDEFTQCDTDGTQDGFTSFDLTTIENQIFSNLPTSFSISFFETTNGTNVLPTNYTNTTSYQQIIYAKITNIQGCYQAYPITLKVNTLSIGQNEIIGLCNGNSSTLSVPNGFTSYSWNTNPVQTTNQINVSSAGIYTVTVTNSNGCSATKTFTVELSEPATITNVTVNDFSDNNSATIEVTGNGTYEYSLDGNTYQASNTFSFLATGNYSFYVRDTKGCGITPGTFQVLAAPKFFTPNGDSFNETWYVPLLALQPKTIITIFDRYGKLIYSFKANQPGWDGTLNGKMLFADDYWYTITFENGRIVKGHFSLIR
ncbi:choice-of-anchor L domain-containing protein [Flavobacterium ponti]|uniref:Choice-of-anchor L domain-containing protein n=1 Tax=Flavobacterium ponti TaxID=665133 RepID=A0ABV9P8N2_9FLAO